MTDAESTHKGTEAVSDDAVDSLRRRMGRLDPRQVIAWRAMSPARRLELAFQPISSRWMLCARMSDSDTRIFLQRNWPGE